MLMNGGRRAVIEADVIVRDAVKTRLRAYILMSDVWDHA